LAKKEKFSIQKVLGIRNATKGPRSQSEVKCKSFLLQHVDVDVDVDVMQFGPSTDKSVLLQFCSIFDTLQSSLTFLVHNLIDE
jgi:hypothetical protein